MDFFCIYVCFANVLSVASKILTRYGTHYVQKNLICIANQLIGYHVLPGGSALCVILLVLNQNTLVCWCSFSFHNLARRIK